MGRRAKEVEDRPAFYRLTFISCCILFPTFSVFQVVYHEYPCALSLKSVTP